MNERIRPVCFPNRTGHMLVGMLHEPLMPRSDVAIVLLAAGIKGRVGPHRLYRRMAAELTRVGLYVLRFDFYGLGDSQGTVTEPLLADVYGSVSLGRYVDDTQAAVEWTCTELGVRKVIVGGLCGGAITGLLAAATNSQVAGLLALGMPITVDGSNVDKVQHMSSGQLKDIRGKYLRKLLNPRAWLRMVSMRTDFRLLVRAITARRNRSAAQPSTPAPTHPFVTEAQGNTNPHFGSSLLRMIQSDRPVLLLFSESDRLYSEFREKFVDLHGFPLASYTSVLNVNVIKGANHVLTFREWQDDMLAQAAAWVAAKFPAPSAEGKESAPHSAFAVASPGGAAR